MDQRLGRGQECWLHWQGGHKYVEGAQPAAGGH